MDREVWIKTLAALAPADGPYTEEWWFYHNWHDALFFGGR